MMDSDSGAESFHSAHSSSTDATNAGPTHHIRAENDPSFRYVHIFQDHGEKNGKYLFVRNLGPSSIYQTQIILHQQENGACSPKVRRTYLRHALRSRGKTETDRQYENDISTAERLHRDIQKTHGVKPRIAEPLSWADIAREGQEKYFRVSYWSYQNGGSLRAFLDKCYEKRVIVPDYFALHILRQLIETLDQMYTQPRPIFHMNITADNLHLHFAPGAENSLPSLILADFTQAMTARFPDRTTWDIPDVGKLVSSEFPTLAHLAYKLDYVHTVFLTNRNVARQEPDSTQFIDIKIPSLSLLFSAINDDLTSAEAGWARAIRFRNLMANMNMGPLKPKTYESIGAILEATGVHGPWQVGRLNSKTGEVEVLRRMGGASGCSWGYHRPNDGNSDSDSDESIVEREYEAVDDDLCGEDDGWVLADEGVGPMQEPPNKVEVVRNKVKAARGLFDWIFPRV